MTLRVWREASQEEIVGSPIRVSEYESIIIELRTPRSTDTRPELLLDGEAIGDPQPMAFDASDLLWRWRFYSESWCGRTTLTLSDGHSRHALEIAAVPADKKHSEQEYAHMLDRVLAYGPTLAFGLAPGQAEVSTIVGPTPRATHPAVIDCFLGALLQQLRRILADPIREQRRFETYSRLSRNEPVSPRTLAWLASRPNQLARIKSGDLTVDCLQHLRRDTYDHPANRYVVTLLRRLHRSFETTAATLEDFSHKQLTHDLERQRARHLALRTRDAERRVAEALRHPVLERLAPGEMTEGVAQVFSNHPAYARFCKLASRLLDSGLTLENAGDLASSLRRSWDLFELYSLYRTMEALESTLGCDWTVKREPLHHHVLTTPKEGRLWEAKHSDGRRLSLHFQEHFGGAQSGPMTISTARRPDFVLAAYQSNQLRNWVLLDAKYRVAERSIAEALTSMHVYRDSLRWRCKVSGAEHAASAGYLLVPAIAPECQRFAESEYIRKRGFGLICTEASEFGAIMLEASGV